MTTLADEGPLRADVRSLLGESAGGVLITSDELLGTLTYTLPGVHQGDSRAEPLSVRVPTSLEAVHWVHQEARLLVELRRRGLGPIERTIPRHVGVRQLDGRLVAMATTLPGLPMAVECDRLIHLVRPDLVRRDFRRASGWLSRFQEASAAGTAPLTWVAEVVEALGDRSGRHPLLPLALARLSAAGDRLDGHTMERTAVHGDFSPASLLLQDGEVSGVVNWARGEPEGWPLRDVVRFALRYSQLRAPSARHALVGALLGTGWFPRTAQGCLRDGLVRVGVPADLWYDAALVGIAEMAAEAGDERTGEELLAVLASLPARR